MKCCGECFNDWFLKREISYRSDGNGICDFTKSRNVPVVEAGTLKDSFELVCEIYEEDEDGKPLVELLDTDWNLFSVESDIATSLLTEILGDEDRVIRNHKPSESGLSDSLQVWEALCQEIRTKNRYRLSTKFNSDRFGYNLLNLVMHPEDVPQKWYRARIEDSGEPIPKKEMGAPPAIKTGPGRANPVGIPYLYVGSTRDTAIKEVRPHPGEVLSVAEIVLEDDLELVDLRDPRTQASPFVWEDSSDAAILRGDIDFLAHLGQELATPVVPKNAAIDYIPSQYLCEVIKQEGYHGVVYASSVSADGINLAVFDPDIANVGTLSRVKVTSIDLDYSDFTDK